MQRNSRKNLRVPVTCLLLLGSHAAGANPRQITGDWTVEGQESFAVSTSGSTGR